MPTALVTTPESLTILLSYTDARRTLSGIRTIIIDEWHELLSTKRGTQAELALARLRTWFPGLRIWGLSATVGNLEGALKALKGNGLEGPSRIIRGSINKQISIESVIPKKMDHFPWSGHLGIHMLDQVLPLLDNAESTLLFTNTRSGAERWYQEILAARPEWAGEIALHHGSIDLSERRWTEQALAGGKLRCVVCTSSLDLGVDFTPVDQVIQVGSPKGVGRLIQRAGRSGHKPGAISSIRCVPTHAFELIESSAVRIAAEQGWMEIREELKKPLDVLIQHVVTIGLGGGFIWEELFQEVRSTAAFRELTLEEWNWVIDFVAFGGKTLANYPEFHKLKLDESTYKVIDRRIGQRHRLSIGTITSEQAVEVRFQSGKRLGTIEESFVSKLFPGDEFIFAGKHLEFLHLREMSAIVRKIPAARPRIPRWTGGRMPLSTELARAVRQQLEKARNGVFEDPEMIAVKPILDLQKKWSAIPNQEEVLVEQIHSKEGFHLLIYPFEGRLVHEGLAALIAYRISQIETISFTTAANDYGFELLSANDFNLADSTLRKLLSLENLMTDIRASMNSTQMAKGQFREIARVSGLVFQGYPGRTKTSRQIDASASLIFDVFSRYDPENLLLLQSEREVLENQLEHSRMVGALKRLRSASLVICRPERLTPFAFPIAVDRLRNQLTSEKLHDRIRRMTLDLEEEMDR